MSWTFCPTLANKKCGYFMAMHLQKLLRKSYEFPSILFNASGPILLPSLGCIYNYYSQIFNYQLNRCRYYFLFTTSFTWLENTTFCFVDLGLSLAEWGFLVLYLWLLALYYLLLFWNTHFFLMFYFLSVFHIHHIPLLFLFPFSLPFPAYWGRKF